jgi:hypothetical protein
MKVETWALATNQTEEEKIKCMFMSHHQNEEENHNIKIINEFS